jgi:hypothetical protein
MTMSKKTQLTLTQVQATIDDVVSDRSVSRDELRDFLGEVASLVESISAGLDADDRAEAGR